MYFSRQPPLSGERRLRHRHHYISIIIFIFIRNIIIVLLIIIIVISSGLSGEKGDLEHRQDVFGSNTIPPKPPKTFLEVTPPNKSLSWIFGCIVYDIVSCLSLCDQSPIFSLCGRPCKMSHSSSWRWKCIFLQLISLENVFFATKFSS